MIQAQTSPTTGAAENERTGVDPVLFSYAIAGRQSELKSVKHSPKKAELEGITGRMGSLSSAPKEFLRLFKAGQDAARQGNKTQAHELFRRAIEIDPYHEQVWLWLASVVETAEDRRVCFENVLELNPANPTARRQLDYMEQKALHERLNSEDPQSPNRWRLMLLVGLLAVALAVGAALIVITG